MLEPWETFEHRGLTCELHQDDDPMSPDDWDTLGTLAGVHSLTRNYRGFRDVHDYAETALERAEGDAALLLRYLSLVEGVVAIPFRFDDYGANGARIYESDEPNGYLYVDRLRLASEAIYDDDEARRILRGELRTWSAYYEGLVAGYVVRDPSGDVVDSCWGYYVDTDETDDDGRRTDGWEYVRAEARDAAEAEADERERTTRAGIATKGSR